MGDGVVVSPTILYASLLCPQSTFWWEWGIDWMDEFMNSLNARLKLNCPIKNIKINFIYYHWLPFSLKVNPYQRTTNNKDKNNKLKMVGQVAFEVLVKPGSFTTRGERVGLVEELDVVFGNGELEWFVKEAGAVCISSLLLRVVWLGRGVWVKIVFF